MTGAERPNYRQQLADELKVTPKENRREVLNKAQEDAKYWQSKSDRAKSIQDEAQIDGGLGVFIKYKTLYHGTGIAGIRTFKPAEETTVGAGVYLTSEAKGAIGYSRERSETTRTEPRIYEAEIENIKLLDLRNDNNVQKILPGFQRVLESKLGQVTDKDPWYIQAALQSAMEEISGNKIKSGYIKLMAQSQGKLFSEYVQSLGYDGLITLEGGESYHTEDHDTYLIFDPEKVKIKKEHKII